MNDDLNKDYEHYLAAKKEAIVTMMEKNGFKHRTHLEFTCNGFDIFLNYSNEGMTYLQAMIVKGSKESGTLKSRKLSVTIENIKNKIEKWR